MLESSNMKISFPPDVPDYVEEQLHAYSPLLQRLLYARGITTTQAAKEFLNTEYIVHNPFLLLHMDRAVDRIIHATENKEHIVVYGDYDCDGIPASAVLHDFFKKIGANFSHYIPHRHNEGYGLTIEAIETLPKRGTQVIISVDSGITDVAAVARAQELGMDVIITDHHLPQEVLPSAYAIINPKQDGDSYPFKELCGSGIAFKLVQGLIAKGNFNLPVGWEKWLLDLVGIATIADMVHLSGENRVLATYGLVVLRKSPRPGLQHLLRGARVKQHALTEDDIGFTIAPRVNAASRMDEPMQAFHLLTTRDETEAGVLAKGLESINRKRKTAVARITREVKKKLGDEELDSVIFMGNPHWRPSLVGLVATTLAQELERPVFLWGRDGKGKLKGSCRSGGNINLVELMTAAGDIFEAFGGHAAAGGFEVREESIHTAKKVLSDACRTLSSEESERVVAVDGTLSFRDITKSFFDTLQQLAPFGVGNPKPVFLFKNVSPHKVSFFGKDDNHLRLVFVDEGVRMEVISFFVKHNPKLTSLTEGHTFSFTGVLEQDTYNGGIRIRLVEILT